MKSITVAAAILVRSGGEILLGKRPDHKNMGGLWEFTGGKIEPGETPETALIRELQEELGIVVEPSALTPFRFISYSYGTPTEQGEARSGRGLGGQAPQPNKELHLLMLCYIIDKWSGEPAALEHSALAWVAPKDLNNYSMPPADLPLIAALKNAKY